MIEITRTIAIHEDELQFSFTRSSGPGGQHVNTSDTAVRLTFDVTASGLPQAVKTRLRSLAGNRMTEAGLLQLECQMHRSQRMNRETVTERFIELVKMATQRPKKRRATKPTRGAKERRIAAKKRRSQVKQQRRNDGDG